MDKNNKSIYEMEETEVKSKQKTLKSEVSTLQTEFNNNTCKMVFGRRYEVEVVVNGEKTTVSDFIETDTFEEIVKEGVENYGTLCVNLFGDGKVNNEEVKEITKNLGVPKNLFWNIIWKKIKIEFKETQLEKCSKRLEYLKKQEEEEGEE